MPQKLDWLRSKRLLRVTLAGDLSKEEVMSLDSAVHDALASEPACEAVIFDISKANRVATHVYQSHLKRSTPENHPLKYICIVGEHRLLRLMLMLAYKGSKASIQLFSDQGYAINFLRIKPNDLESGTTIKNSVTA